MTLGGNGRRRPALRHARRQRGRPFRRVLAVAGVGVAAFVASGSVFTYDALQGNIERHDVSGLLGDTRPETSAPNPVDPGEGRPLNILVMGSDVRSGENAPIGGAPETEGMRSDTTLVVHISADRSRADIVSIPRDLLVEVPACALPDGTESRPATAAMFNSAFATGGDSGQVEYAAACAIKTVEQMTGVFIDDFVVVDFVGFIRMVDALGGIPMCVPEPVFDRFAGLDLDAGWQTLTGGDALAYARARKNVGDGSDISRIGRQQLLLGAMIRQTLSKNLLTDLPELYAFLDAATESVTAGPMIGRIPNIVGLANSLRGLPAGGVTFVTVPFDWAGPRVRPNADSALLWAAIAADEPLRAGPVAGPQPGPTPTPGGSPGGSPSASPSASPAPTATEQPWDFVTGATRPGVCD